MTPHEERLAILRGARAAEQLLRDLGVSNPRSAHRVDVFGAIVRSGAALMFRPLEPLLGAFLSEEGERGIVVTTRRPLGLQRFTAAHELGHLTLGHEPQADDDGILRRGPLATRSDASVVEREADAFASYFLIPNTLIAHEISTHGWTRDSVSDPGTVYQASLRFGASYSATVYAFEREKIISPNVRRSLLAAKPKTLKEELLDRFTVQSPWQRLDVWSLTEKDEGTIIEAGREDLFIVRLRENSGAGYLWNFDELADAGFVILRDGRERIMPNSIGGPVLRSVLGRFGPAMGGDYQLRQRRPWDSGEQIAELRFSYSLASTDEEGLWQPQRSRLLEA